MENLSEEDNSSQTISEQEDQDNAARRELLARRPSYRKILNDLSAGSTGSAMMGDKIPEEEDSNDSGEDSSSQIVYSSGNNNAVGRLASAASY
ncbi:hypothetical protein EB796_020613 [Bugula neritina]|uniref:KID domain-containing protein n=1 Tax=Bugula neritina TaxID=10212 RepID=A0A7J7J5S4_BUGNE|nr:hypothetical protein EB796_020613 [Bugula neritina]